MPTLNLSIPCPRAATSAPDLEVVVLEALTTGGDNAFIAVVKKLAEKHDVLAEYLPDSFAVEGVNLKTQMIHFCYGWFANYGCSDVRKEGTERDYWRFKVEDNQIVVSTYLPEESPSTCNEF